MSGKFKSTILLTLLFSVVTNPATALEQDPPNQPTTQALYLHTESYPCAENPPEGDPDLIVRELIRQAILIAAREELHVPTFDETLGETTPSNLEVLHLYLQERRFEEGHWRVTLFAYDLEKQQKSHQLWEKEYQFDADRANLYDDMAAKLNVSITEDLTQALRSTGLRENKTSQKENVVVEKDTLESMLQEVDFVKQFAAVRSAHQAIALSGESPENLGILIRGYANLSMLSWHQYNATTYAFAARSWLYAERLKTLSNEDNHSLWHSAYAWALGGRLNHALADLKQVAKQIQESPETEISPPDWVKLVESYCKSDREATKQIGKQNQQLNPWSTRLWFEITRTYQNDVWTYHAGTETVQVSPTAYGVYATMSAYGAGLRTSRTGAYQAPIAFGQHAPQSLDSVPGISKTIRDFLPTNALKQSLLSGIYKDPDPEDPFSAALAFISRLLRLENEKNLSGDLSWTALAYLLEEEMFVQIVNFLSVATNATESSQADEVDAVMPLIKDHKYAAYIDMMRYNWRHEVEQIKKTVENIEIIDARRNMVYMGYRLWYFKDKNGKSIGEYALQHASLCYTIKGILIHYYFVPANWKLLQMDVDSRSVSTLDRIAPDLEFAVRFKIHTTKDSTIEQLDAWEKLLSQDVKAFSKLGELYESKGDNEKAAACYQKSLEILPSFDTTRKLANIFWENDFDRWEKPLLNFLSSEHTGLAHSRIHRQLALGYQYYGLWQKAKPHAVAAGQTWSAAGLKLASYNCEALAEWQESEYWIREMSQKYPSYNGEHWYFWCRRTGRGNLLEAQELAQEYFDSEPSAPTRNNQVHLGAYRILEHDLPGALQAYQKAQSFKTTFTCSYMIAQIARQLENEEMRDQVLAEIEQAAADPEHFGKEVTEVGLAIVELLKTGDDSPEKIEHIEKLLENYDVEVTRSAFAYFVGAELDALGNPQEAEKFWRYSLTLPARDNNYATLAGNALSERHGTSRQGDQALDIKDLWPIRKIEDLKNKLPAQADP